MITIRDVARQAGVSVATVSRVLNNSTLVSADTREAVMKAVSELDYPELLTHSGPSILSPGNHYINR